MLSQAEIADYRTRLHEALATLDAEDALGRDGQATVRLDLQAVGRLSRMDAMQQQAMAQATARRRAQERRRLQAAVARIDAGAFGHCTDCGDDLSPRRLDLDPAVARCLDCTRG